MKKEICKNCKYWKVTKDYPKQITNIGKCNKIKMFWDCTEWIETEDDHIIQLKDEHKDDKAFAQDASDYKAYLITKEDFSCNQFN